eukprot:10530624-Prorocentrum_lima.AAC.1
MAILSPNLDGEFEQRVAKWERMIRDYQLTGVEAVPGSINMGMFKSCIAPPTVHEHLALTAQAYDDYESMRDEVRRVC